jgi:membrane fusion protein (multidrug efflux system)
MSTQRSIGVAILALALLIGCARKDAAPGETADGASHAVVAATTVLATSTPFTEQVIAIGTVEPRPGFVAVLSAPIATRVARVLVAAGQQVAKGEALIELEQSGFQSAVATAHAAQASARANRDRLQRLVDLGITPRRELDQASADLARADADATTAQRSLELSVLRSPIAGVVTRLNTTLGASVDPTQPLVEVADPSSVDVLLTVQPSDAARIVRGAKVELHASQRDDADSLGSGSVLDIAGVVDSATRSVAVRVRTTASQRVLRIGETLAGRIAIATRPNAVVIPLAALVPEGDGYKVFVVDSGGIAHARAVSVGGKTDAVAEIRSGLAAGERVVTYGAFGVEDGAKIVAPGTAAAVTPKESAATP